jgi:hypothetical protein
VKRPPPPEVFIDIVASPEVKLKNYRDLAGHLDQEITLIDLSREDKSYNLLGA